MPKALFAVQDYANEIFEQKIRAIMHAARDRSASRIVPSRYILAVTEEIGQNRANDLSHIAAIREMPNSDPTIRALVTDARIFHDYALALACAHAVAEGIECVLWQKELRYAWM
jgi:hypothetical protein